MRVIVSRYDDAPLAEYHWYATEHGLDLGVPVGYGLTPLAAIDDLLWHIDSEVAAETCNIVWE